MSFTKKMIVIAIAGIGFDSAWAAEPRDKQEMEQVFVTATLRNHTIASAPAFTTVVTAEDIAKSPVNSLPDLLRETVGVNNLTDGTGRDELQIRGLAGKYTLMLINGKRVSSGGALWRGSDFDLSSVPLNSIKRVEIVRGPMAALYGSDAMGGVINIITKKPTAEWKGNLNAEYRTVASGEEGNQYRLGATTSGAVNDKLSLAITGEMYDRDPWYRTPASDTTRTPRLEEKQSRNLMTTATLKLSETQTIDFDFAYNNDKRPLSMYYYAFNPVRKTESRDFRAQEMTRYTYGLNHKADWDWGSTTAFISHEDASIDDFNSRYAKPQDHKLKENNTYAKLYANTVMGANSMTAGIDLRRQVIKDAATYLKTGEISTQSSALFAEDEIALAKSLNLTLAGRMDKSDAFGHHFSPKAYLSYQVNDAVTVKGGVSKAFKAPESYQLSREYVIASCGGSCTLGGNPDLKPEKSTNYEAGVEVHQKRWNASAVVFKNDVDSMIVAFYDSTVPERRWINVAKAKTRGLELQSDVELTSTLSVSGNYTRLQADYTDASGLETKLDNRPKNVAHVTLNWKAHPLLQSSLSANYIGRQYYETKELPAYTRMDLAFSSRVRDNVTLRFGVKNLTDVNLEEKSKSFVSSELGRNYYVSASYAF